MTKLLLLNDTGDNVNPGCKAVTAAIHRLYRARYHGAQFRALPVGYGIPRQSSPASPSWWSSTVRTLRRWVASPTPCAVFPRWRAEAPAVASSVWRRHLALANADPELAALGRWADLVVINGEGTVHHNLPRAVLLLAQAAVLLQRGLPLHFINATIQAMDRSTLDHVLPKAALLHVRERRSAEYLRQQLGIAPLVAPDLAYAYFDPEPPGPPMDANLGRADCLISTGVSTEDCSLVLALECARRAGLHPAYLALSERSELNTARRVCARYDVPLILPSAVRLSGMVPFLRHFRLVVTGRHHLAIFCSLAGVPFLPLPSNTWKVEGTMELIAYPVPPARTVDELCEQMSRVLASPGLYQHMAVDAGQAGLTQVREFSRRLAEV